MTRLQPNAAASPNYRQIWRVVDGAVDLALTAHPEFLAPAARPKTVRNSIVKRVTGAINGYAEQSAWVRSGSSPAHDEAGARLLTGPVVDGGSRNSVGAAERVEAPCSAGGAGPSSSRTPFLPDLDAKEFGFLISEAFHDCNDMDGPHWPTVARKVAEAVGIILTEDAR